MDANGRSENIQTNAPYTHGPYVNIFKDAAMSLEHAIHKTVCRFTL